MYLFKFSNRILMVTHSYHDVEHGSSMNTMSVCMLSYVYLFTNLISLYSAILNIVCMNSKNMRKVFQDSKVSLPFMKQDYVFSSLPDI